MSSFCHCLVLSFCLLTIGCAGNTVVHETVLRPGERLISTNRFGTVQITYVSPAQRIYQWDDFHEERKLQPRNERWYGCLGIYDPAAAMFSAPKVRLVLQEGIKNFRTEKQMMTILRQSSALEDWVYDDTGLVVGFGRVPERGNQVNVDVFQYLINSRRPSTIHGARPSQLHREILDPPLTKKYNESQAKKPQDEIPPLVNDPFDPYGAVGQEQQAGH